MKLILDSGTSMSGRLYRGYLDNWNKCRKNGSYDTGENFLFIHWEAHDGHLNEVRLHVESPKAADSIELNLLKNRIMIGIMSKMSEIEKTIIIGKIKLGGKLFSTDKNKSSEVFRVVLDDANVKQKYEENIIQVHDYIGDIVNKAVLHFNDDFNKYFL